MSRYSQYGYYDPVGSSQPQPTGYTYQSTSNAPSYPSAAASSGCGGNQQNYGSSGYGGQSYGNSAQPSSSANHAAAALSSLGDQQDYNQTSNRSSTGQYDSSQQWYESNAQGSYGTSNLQPPNRSQANNSPLYASAQSGSTFGRLSVPDQSQSNSNYGSNSPYQNAPSSAGTNYRYQTANQAAQNPPQRYNSPLHAVQAQTHQKQSSRGSNQQPSPQMANAAVRYAQQQQSRQQSASVEPSPTTVDPSQVYDDRAELERTARFEAERRKKIEAEQAAKKAEEDRLAAEKQKVEDANRKATEATDAAKKKEQQDRKNDQRRKAREEKRQSKSAATTLQQMASMGAESSAAGGGDDDEEAQMRAMFKKMREFNSKNPAMLAKLWEEERKQHSESQSPQAEKPTPAAVPPKTAQRKPSTATVTPTQRKAGQPNRVPSQKQPAAPKPATASQISPTATSSKPVSSSASTSLWPPHKKGALADATAKWLMGLSENAGKVISQQAVLNILDSNPSYVQLCESLEGLDMKFERSTLARELLKAVPDGLRTAPKPSTPVSAPPSTTEGVSQARSTSQSAGKAPITSSTVSYEAPLSLSDAAREVNQMHKNQQHGGPVQPPQSPFAPPSQNGSRPPSQARATSRSQSQSQSPPQETKPEVKPEEPPRPPANKEEAARKRTFGDLVDLTMDDESDDEGPPPKKQQHVPGPAATNGASVQNRDPLAYLQQQQQQPQDQPNFQAFKYQPHQRSQIPGARVMQPPPRQIVPNNPTSTQAHSAPPKPKGSTAEQVQQSRMRGRMLIEPIMRDRVARKSRYDSATIARDVLLATGRHPDMRGLNAHLNGMQKLLGHHGAEVDTAGTKCDLSTIRWDIIDPEQPKVEKAETAAEKQDAESLVVSVEATTTYQAPSANTVNYEAPFQNQFSGAPPKEKKKRGRPRVSMPNQLTHPLGERGTSPNSPNARASSRQQTPNSAPVDPPSLSRANDMAAHGTPVGYSAFRQIGPDGQVIKTKGRPKGWRKSLHSREAQGLPPSHPKAAGKVKPVKEAGEKKLTEPAWQSFHCEWKGCKAELQNLETLKKHLVKVHGREMDGGRGYQCLWKGCDRQPGEGGGFAEIEVWMGHVDAEHLRAIAWKQGDGPKGGSLGESPSYRQHRDSSSPGYLLDKYGRSVTPIIKPTPPPAPAQQPATTTLPLHTTQEGPKRLGRPPKDGIPKLQRDADTELRKLAEHKRLVGVLMERQGCVLASEERRRTFLGDEEFETVVSGSEGEG